MDEEKFAKCVLKMFATAIWIFFIGGFWTQRNLDYWSPKFGGTNHYSYRASVIITCASLPLSLSGNLSAELLRFMYEHEGSASISSGQNRKMMEE